MGIYIKIFDRLNINVMMEITFHFRKTQKKKIFKMKNSLFVKSKLLVFHQKIQLVKDPAWNMGMQYLGLSHRPTAL
jgi:hypothetical protein